MEKFKCIIIDDDHHAIEMLKAYIEALPNLQLVKTYDNPVQALTEIPAMPKIELILLDINMPQITGIQLSREIRSRTAKLIFTTSYSQYGYEAFESGADGYLLKPFSLIKFTATVAKVLAGISAETHASEHQYFFVKNRNEDLKIVKVWYRDIVAVESKQNYILIHTITKKILTYMSLTEIGKALSKNIDFQQFQRSFIIAKSHIESITGNSIKMDNGLEFTVGDMYRASFQQFVRHNLLKTGD